MSLRCRQNQLVANTSRGLWLLAAVATSALAQTPPDAGRILQETRPPGPPPAPTIAPIQAPPARAPAAAKSGGDEVRVQVSQFEFSGNLALSTETLNATVAPWVGRALNFGELIQAVEAVEARYKADGYFLAQGYLPPQKIKDGTIEIAISEGRLGETRIEGESRIAPAVLFGYLDRLPKGEALTMAKVERQVLLINELAGGHFSLDLQAGEQAGSTDIVLAQQSDPPLNWHLDANNHGSPSTGSKRLGLNVNANSPFNLGERISANVMITNTGNLTSYGLRGDLPVGGDGWHLSAAASRATYSLGGDFANLDASGTADSLRLGAAYPLIRSRANNLKLQIEADKSKLTDHIGAPPASDKDKQSRGLTATLAGDWLDEWMGGGSSRIDLAVRSAQLDLDSAAASADAPPAGPNTAGHFNKVNFSAQRQQNLSKDLSLQLQFTRQLAGKNLDSSEKLSLGGTTTLPGYANGEASGDSGTLVKLALRWQAQPALGLSAFADYGRLQLLHEPLPATTTSNDKRMRDIGLSADWMLNKDLSLSAIVAWAGNEAPNPTDNAKPRFWLNLGYGW